MQAIDIENNFLLQQSEQAHYKLTKMKFTDGRKIYGHFLMADQSQSLKSQNKWVFYFDEIRLIIHGDDIAAFYNIYSGIGIEATYA